MDIKNVMAVFLCLVNINNGAMEKENSKRKKIMERYRKTQGPNGFLENEWLSLSPNKLRGYYQKKAEVVKNFDSTVEIFKQKVIDFQTFLCNGLMSISMWVPALKMLKLILHSGYDGSFIYANLEKVVTDIDKHGKYGWADTPESVQKSPLYTITHILVSKSRQHFLALKDEEQRTLLREGYTILLINMINQFYFYYEKRRMNDNGRAPASAYESYLNLFLDNIPHDRQQIICEWKEVEKQEPRLKQHYPFHADYVRNIESLNDSTWIADNNLSKEIGKFQIERLCHIAQKIGQIENNTPKS